MSKYLIWLFLPATAIAGPYIEVGLGVPLDPAHGYIPDDYGILSVGYISRVSKELYVDIGAHHRSLTGIETCGTDTGGCTGDNAIEAKLRLEW